MTPEITAMLQSQIRTLEAQLVERDGDVRQLQATLDAKDARIADLEAILAAPATVVTTGGAEPATRKGARRGVAQ